MKQISEMKVLKEIYTTKTQSIVLQTTTLFTYNYIHDITNKEISPPLHL